MTNQNVLTIGQLHLDFYTRLILVIDFKTNRIIESKLVTHNPLEETREEFEFEYNEIVDHVRGNLEYHSIYAEYNQSDTPLEIKFETNSNKVQLESIYEKIKTLVTLESIEKNSRALRDWRKTVPKNFKSMTKVKKASNPEFQRLLFESTYFQEVGFQFVNKAVSNYNSDSKIEDLNQSYENEMALTISQKEDDSMQKVENEFEIILNSEIRVEERIAKIERVIVESGSETQDLIKQSFINLTWQNQKLFEQNQELENQLESFQSQLASTSQLLHEKLKQERQLEERKERQRNRKRLSKRKPITKEIYEFFISEANTLSYRQGFRGARLRLALALLLVTGVRIGQLLPLKIHQVKTLFEKSWIAIDRKKRGPANHKAFLTKEGSLIMRERQKDFEFLSHFKEDGSYIFTAENSEEPLKLEAFNRIINQFIKQCSKKLEGNPNLKSHSFRIGFSTQLWRDTNDIEFVKQTIGHTTIDTTSQYIGNLSEKERQERILQVEKNR